MKVKKIILILIMLILINLNYPINVQYYITSNTFFSLISSDTQSDVKVIYYKLDNGDFQIYKKPFRITTEGFHVVYYYSIDNVGNKTPVRAVYICVDNTPPVISIYSHRLKETENMYIIPPGEKISIKVKDNLSGVNSIKYLINNSNYRDYYKPIEFKFPGKFILKVRAEDRCGNTSIKDFLIKVVGNKRNISEYPLSSVKRTKRVTEKHLLSGSKESIKKHKKKFKKIPDNDRLKIAKKGERTLIRERNRGNRGNRKQVKENKKGYIGYTGSLLGVIIVGVSIFLFLKRKHESYI